MLMFNSYLVLISFFSFTNSLSSYGLISLFAWAFPLLLTPGLLTGVSRKLSGRTTDSFPFEDEFSYCFLTSAASNAPKIAFFDPVRLSFIFDGLFWFIFCIFDKMFLFCYLLEF